MNIDLSPKKQFQANQNLAAELAKVVGSDNFQSSVSAAFMEWIWRVQPTQDQIAGARAFVRELMHLPFPDTPLPEFPVKRLDHSVYERTQPPQTNASSTRD